MTLDHSISFTSEDSFDENYPLQPNPKSQDLELPFPIDQNRQLLDAFECNDQLRDVLNLNSDNQFNEDQEAFFTIDLNAIKQRYAQWVELLPMVEPHYAVKCNTTSAILKTLQECGTGFDCASKDEMVKVRSIGVSSDRVIFANPCKQISHIRYAAEFGVRKMTFDNADELHKIKRVFPDAQLVLRVLTDDSRSVCRLGTKFGAAPEITEDLLKLAKELKLNVIGVSFHVGSGCFDPTAFSDAVYVARKVFDEGEALGFDFSLLDIGGGFSGLDGVDGAPFADIARCLRPVLIELFPSTRIIAEPGRYFVASACTLAVNVVARRSVLSDEQGVAFDPSCREFMYYVNDGVYGSFNCLIFDHAIVSPKVLRLDGILFPKVFSRPFSCSIWGPTCDSIDCISKKESLPELNIGDWLYFPCMGAYTMSAASTFNGMPLAAVKFC